MTDLITSEEAKKLLDGTDLVSPGDKLARTVIALHAQLADAQAAQVLVVEKALNLLDYHVTNDDDRMTMRQAIRDLAHIDGLALVRELRDRAEKAETLRDEAVEKYAAGVDKRLADQTRAESAEAERDRLAAANAVLETRVAGLRSAFRVNMLRFGPPGTSHEEIDAAIDAALATPEGEALDHQMRNGFISTEQAAGKPDGTLPTLHGPDHPRTGGITSELHRNLGGLSVEESPEMVGRADLPLTEPEAGGVCHPDNPLDPRG